MSIPWTQGHFYALTPFCLIPRVRTVTLITPWQTPLWYPQVLEMLIRRPILISSSTTLLVDSKGNPHPLVLNKSLTLVTLQVSGSDYLSRVFLRKQPSLLASQEGKVLLEITNRSGRSGLAGVTHGKLIHFDAM